MRLVRSLLARSESTIDPDARLYKKSYGKESKLAYLGHALVENRHGLIAAGWLPRPTAKTLNPKYTSVDLPK